MGINGTGKTSVLKAIPLGVLSPIHAQLGYRPYCLVRRRQDEKPLNECDLSIQIRYPNQELHFQTDTKTGRELHTLFIRREGSEDVIDQSLHALHWETTRQQLNDQTDPAFFMIGYGATRRSDEMIMSYLQQASQRHPRYQRVAGLFVDSVTMYPLQAWYQSVESDSRQKQVRDLLNSLLPEGTTFTGQFKDADALFLHNGVKLPFGALSDGFRSYIGLVADMLYHMNYVCSKKSKLTSLSGVVMIDDIDVHLHPKWQREVVPKLAKTFPKLQFIITSHSPLVAGTLHAANIRVVEDNQIHEYTERIHGLNADQILTSSYFGLDSSRSPDAEMQLAHTAKRVADTHDPAPAIEFLKELTGGANGQTTEKTKKSGKRK